MGELKIGKCLTGVALITVKNKKTGLIEKITITDFHKRLKAKNV